MKLSTTIAKGRSISSPSPAVTEPTRNVKAGIAGLSLAMLMPSLATSIANAALPSLAGTFAISFESAQWIVLAYLLTMTVAVAIAGKIGDLFGRRRLMLSGIAVFAGASLLCGCAPTLPLLIVARAAQGLGAAMMMALTMAFTADIVPKARAGRAMGLLGTMSAIGTTLGPSLGGIMIASAGWRSIFLVNVPLALLAFVLLGRALPTDRSPGVTTRGEFDVVGTILIAVALSAYALAMTVGRGQFGQLNFGLILLAVGAGVALLKVEAKSPAPLVQLGLFQNPVFVTSIATSALISTVMMATLIVGPFYLAGALRLDAFMLGIVLSAGPLVAALTGLPAGRLVDQFGANRACVMGLIVVIGGTAALSVIPASFGVLGYIFPVVAMTSGYALFQAANNTTLMTNALPNQRGAISGMLNLARNLGLLTGASLMGAIFSYGAQGDVVRASPEAVASGMRMTIAAACGLAIIALWITRGRRGRTVSR